MQLTINTIQELKNFVNRPDVSIKSAFEVTERFLNVREPRNDENRSACISIGLFGGTGEPDFTKENIINWINDFDKAPLNCVAIFSFR